MSCRVGTRYSAFQSSVTETNKSSAVEESIEKQSHPVFGRDLLQETNASSSEDASVSSLDCDNLTRFYNEPSRLWVLNNETLEFVNNDVQRIVDCTNENDTLLFQTDSVIKPSRTLVLSQNLTLGSFSETEFLQNQNLIPSTERVRFTCSESGQFILSRSPSFTLINIAIEDCSSTLSLIELDSDCSDARPSQTVGMLDILIERNELYGQGRILNSRDPSCFHLELDDVIIQENLCDGGGSCVSLSSSNTLRNIQLLRNNGSGNSSLDNSIFFAPEGSTTNATNVTSKGNLIRSFLVLSGTLNITNSHFSDNTINQDGGAIRATMNSSLLLTHSSFSSNEGRSGGAIFLNSSTGIVLHCNFSVNKAEIFGGAIFMQQYTSETISSCSFTNNSAVRDGGAIEMYQGTNGQISNCNFTNSRVEFFGGAIYILESTNETVSNCSFIYNTAGRDGGAIRVYQATNGQISNCNFTNNRVGFFGGAIYIVVSTYQLISNSIFANNIAEHDGGAMRMQECNETQILYCSFTHNSARNNGGAIDLFLSTMPILADSTFSSNQATNGGGVLLVNISNGLISNCNFSSNMARTNGGNEAGYGGALLIRVSSFANVSSCYLSNNSAINHGGATHVLENSNAFYIDSVFSNNEATYGGSVCIQFFSSVLATNCSFTYNTARSNGGAFDVFSDAMLNVITSTFSNNDATRGGAVFLMNSSNGTVYNCDFTSNVARANGGAFYMYSISTLTLSNSTLLDSEATYGGALYLEESSSGMISQCYFTNNRAQRTGGSIDAKQKSMVTCLGSSFSSNEARFGGGMHLNSSHGTISNCTFKHNEATNYGGVFFAQRNSSLTLSDSFFSSNKAEYGGAFTLQESSKGNVSNNIFSNNVARMSSGVIYLRRRATLFMHSTRLHNNRAQNGGVLLLEESSNGTITNCIFTNNTATKDGGAICLQAHSILNLSNSVLQRNLANEFGGALYLHSSNISLLSSILNFNNAILGGALYGINATMNITHSTFEINHARGSGGAVYMKNSSTILEETIIQSNEAGGNFGGICALEVSHLNASNLIVQSNSAGNLGGGVGIGNGSTILCYLCNVSNNKAFSGAGLYIYVNNSISIVAQLQNSRFENNSARFYAGGLEFYAPLNRTINCRYPTAMCSYVVMLNTEFLSNFANLLGGAILTSYASGVLIDCEHRPRIRSFVNERFMSSLRSIHPKGLCSSWIGNQVLGNAHGANVGTYGQKVVLSIDDDSLNDVKLVGNPQTGYLLENVSSGKQLPTINVTVLDEFGVGPAPTIPRAFEARFSNAEGLFLGEYRVMILNGFGSFNDVGVSADPGNYTLRVELDNASFETINVTVIVRECRMGEAFFSDLRACQECDALSYNFNVSGGGGCTQCPNGGDCTRQYIIPKKGYWHKSPCHSTVQECLVKEACSYDNRHETLVFITSNIIDCTINNCTLKAYNDELCNEGYQGPLCGSCSQNFGLSSRFMCRECTSNILSLLVIIGVTLYLLGATVITIKGCLPSNLTQKGSHLTTNLSAITLESSDRAQQVNIQMAERNDEGNVLQDRLSTNNEATLSETEISIIQQETEFELTRWKLGEIFKIMINFLQTTGVAATINVPWTKEMSTMFATSDYIGALTIDAISRPVDCLVSTGSTPFKALWRMIVSVSIPLIVLGILTFFWIYVTIKNGKGGQYFLKRFTLSAISVAYISYLGLTKMAVRAFYCVDVYDSVDHLEQSTTKLWAVDTSIMCYEDDHAGIIVIAALVLLFVTFSYPLLSFIALIKNKENVRRGDKRIFEMAGFLFRAFKEKFAFWETIVMLRKACLSVICVFSYSLGGDSQLLLVSVLLFFCLYMQLTLRPYRGEFKILNHFESISLLVSGLTFSLGQFFIEGRCNDPTRTFLVILIIFGNSMFLLSLLLALFYNSMVHLRVTLQCENIPLPVPPIWGNILKVYIYSRYTKWRQLQN
eukprot:g3761.t1